MDVRVAIYLVTGFLESGKSTFLDFTLRQDYFQIEEPSLLVLCEEGEVEVRRAEGLDDGLVGEEEGLVERRVEQHWASAMRRRPICRGMPPAT